MTQNIGAQHHAGAASGRRVIDLPMLAETEIANLDGIERPDACVARLSGERDAERTWKHLRKKRQHERAPAGACRVALGDVWHQAPSTIVMSIVPAPWRSFLASAYSGDVA